MRNIDKCSWMCIEFLWKKPKLLSMATKELDQGMVKETDFSLIILWYNFKNLESYSSTNLFKYFD